MSEQEFIPAQEVAKKIKSIRSEADKLHEAIDSRISEVAVESTCLIKTFGDNNFGALPTAFFKLETIAETVKQMYATLHDAASTGEASQLDASPREKPTNLISRVEKLEALLTSTCLHYEGLENGHSQILDSIKAQKAQITSQEKKIDQLQGTVSSLQENKAFLEKELKRLEEKPTPRSPDFSQDIIQTVDAKINSFENKYNDVFRQMHNLKSSVGWIDGQMNVLTDLRETVESKLVERTDPEEGILKKRLQKVETKSNQLCQILSAKVVQLEKVRDALNTAHARVSSRSNLEKLCKENQDAIDNLSKQMGKSVQQYQQCQNDIGALTTQMSRLDSQVCQCRQKQESTHTSMKEMVQKECRAERDAKPRIGFSAQLPTKWRYKKGFTLRNMNYITCNEGGCFNKEKGQFIVPQEGLYCFALTLHQAKNEPFTAAILCDSDMGHDKSVGTVIVDRESSYSIVAPKYLFEGDVVYVEITEAEKRIELLETTTFSGWLIE